MKFRHLFYISKFILFTLLGCAGSETSRIVSSGIIIRLSPDSSSVQLYNIPLNIAEELHAHSMGTDQWHDFFAVYEEISDEEMRDFQPPVDGSYIVRDSLIEFTPAKEFIRGRSYFSRAYSKDVLEGAEDIISNGDLSPASSFLEYKFTIK